MQAVKAAELVLDFDLYPRPQVDGHHVSEIVAALEAGAELPPVVYDAKSKRVSDGFHRIRANIRAFGPDCEIMGIAKKYKNEQELFLDAMRYNSDHGRNLTQYDRARCVIISERLGLDDSAVADVLHVTVDRLGELKVRKTAQSNGDRVAIKRTIGHMSGKRLSKKQKETNACLGGMTQLFYVNQLIMLIESDLLDKANEKLTKRLIVLMELLGGRSTDK